MNSSVFEAVIFDMDGVLVDSEPHHVAIEKKMFDKLNLDITEEQHQTYMGKATDIMWREIIRDKGLSYSSTELVEITVSETVKHFQESDLKPMPGLIEVLTWLQVNGIPVAVASSSGQEVIDVLLKKIGVQEFFKYTVSSELVGGSKPDPGIFIYTASKLGIASEKCIVIEDSKNGVRAALAANMYCIGYGGATIGNDISKEVAFFTRDYKEIKHKLKELLKINQ